MKLKIIIPFLFLIHFLFAQEVLTTEQVKRLADTGKVYGVIKYFHPWLQYETIIWGFVFAANMADIINSKNKEQDHEILLCLQELIKYILL